MKKMEKIFFVITLLIFLLISCDPSESLEAIIINKTSSDLNIHFVSKIAYPELSNNTKTFTLLSYNKVYFIKKGINKGLGQAVLSFVFYDSIYITNTSDKILKVYKENTFGKNIYNVDKYWKRSKPSKNFFEYTYEITNGDIGN